MAISRSKMNRQLRESGGIMNVARREQFGLGSSIKRAVRKVIPNEVSKIAVKAAPFVAPFNPALAGAMAGIGSFDQTGSLSDAFKRGALTYGGGQAARFIGGAGFQQNPFTQGGAFRGGLEGFKGGFTTPFGTDTGLGKFFDKTGAPVKEVQPLGVDEKAAEAISKNIAETGMELRELTMAGQPVGGADPGVYISPLEYKQFAPTVSKEVVLKSQPKILDLIKDGNYTEAAVEAGRKALSSVFTTPITNAKGEVVGSKLDKTALFAAGSFGLTYLDAKKIADEVGEDIGTEEEYDEATKAAKKEEYAGYLTNFFGGKKDGGRIGFAEGTYGDFKEFMEKRGMAIEELNKNRLLEEFKEYMKRKDPTVEAAEGGRIGYGTGSRPSQLFKLLEEAQAAGDDDKIKEIKLDLFREFGLKLAKGGRIGYNEGGFGIMQGIKAAYGKGMDKSIPKIKKDEDLTREEIARIKMAVFEVLDQTAGGDKSTLSGGFIDNLGDALEQIARPDLSAYIKDYAQGTGIFAEDFIVGGKEDILKKADGGRIGLREGTGSKKKYSRRIEKAVRQIDPLKQGLEDIKAGGGGLSFGGYKFTGGIGGGKSPFSKEAIAFLFKTLGKTGGKDRKYTMPNLYKILNNPGKFPNDEKALAAFLKVKGFREGGRAELAMGSEVPVRKNKAGIEELDYRESGGFVPIGVKEKADDVPAMLSKNEFVMTADAVRGIGNGSVERGAEKLYNVMNQAEKVGKE